MVPLVNESRAGADGSVYVLARDRAQCRRGVQAFLDRANTEFDSAAAVTQRTSAWLSTPVAQRRLSVPAGVTVDAAVLAERWLAGEKLSNADDDGGDIGALLRAAEEDAAQRAFDAGLPSKPPRVWGGSTVRKLVRSLQEAGWPLVADGDNGYRLIEGTADTKRWATKRMARVDSLRARATRLENAGKLWYPETEAESAATAAFRQDPPVLKVSPMEEGRTQTRDAAKTRAAARKDEADAVYRDLAQTMLDNTTARAQAARHRECSGSMTNADRALLRRRDVARKFLRNGRRPKLGRNENYDFLPPRAGA
jgi:hypothetical protein